MAKPVVKGLHSLTAAGPSRNHTEFPVRGGLKISHHRHLAQFQDTVREGNYNPAERNSPTQARSVSPTPLSTQ
jgi:hypothetical protein